MAVKDLKYFEQFDIKLSILTIGIHEFTLNINNTFFSKHKNEEIKGANVKVLLKVSKKENLCLFTFTVKGELTLECDVCLDDLQYSIATEETFILKLSKDDETNEDVNILYIKPNDYIYNVEQVLYEMIYAQIPMRKSHEDLQQTCNKNMTTRLELYTNKQRQQTYERWDALKKLNIK